MKSLKQNSTPKTIHANVPLPLVTPWAIVDPPPSEPDVVPAAVSELAAKIRQWMKCDKARTPMNRTFASWKTRSPQKIRDIVQWLSNPNTQKSFRESGAYGQRIKLVNALTTILSGEKAHAAFGQNKNSGRPTSPGFSRVHDAALYAEYLTRMKGFTFNDATFVAAEAFDAREESVKTKVAQLQNIDNLTIKEMAALSCSKYGIIP